MEPNIYWPGDISFTQFNFYNAFIWENKSYNSFDRQVIWALTCLQTQDIKSAELHKKCSYEVRNFDCSNLPNVCSVKFTNHSWRTEIRQHHSFISEAKLSSILPLPKDASSTFGLPPQIDFVTSKCRYTILWLPLFVPDNKCYR